MGGPRIPYLVIMASGINMLLHSFKGAGEHGKLGRSLFLTLASSVLQN